MKDLKFKPLNKEQLIISIDRLTRFKETETKYLRVFRDIIISNLIEPKYKKSELEEMDYGELTQLAQTLINKSLEALGININSSYSVNQKLYDYENRIFKLDEETKKLLKNKINYDGLINLIENDIPKNLAWLRTLVTSENPDELSHISGYQFPITKLIICEGITEEILLPEFAKLLDYDFSQHGIYIISAGGKNQVVKTFYRFAQNLKIPIFVLLDSDAEENYNEIYPKLRDFDKIHILSQGEFEDNLPVKLIEKTLKFATENISLPAEEAIDANEGMVHYLEEYFKTRGIHEFKKAEFAHLVKQNITEIEDVSEEFKTIIDELRDLKCVDLK